MKPELKKLLILNAPYLLFVYLFDKIGQAVRLSPGADLSGKVLSLADGFSAAFANPLPSLAPMDLLIGIVGAVLIRLIVYVKGKNAKKYRKGIEYGSARWGNAEDIKPYTDPVFQNNVLLTQTERLTMNSRPKQPKYARNKNILVIGGSGSGKTRFFVKPNLMQMHSSYVVTDPKGTVLVECGKLLQRGGYRIKVLNTINFKKSMKYNPFAYLRSEKDILKLVNTLIANTKGDGEKAGEDFWIKSERLFYCALIGYIWYEAPEEEKNFTTLLEMINASEAREDDPEFQSPVDLMFERLEEKDPEHFAVRQYKKFLLSAGKTRSSIPYKQLLSGKLLILLLLTISFSLIGCVIALVINIIVGFPGVHFGNLLNMFIRVTGANIGIYISVLPIILIFCCSANNFLGGVALAFVYGYFGTFEGTLLNYYPIKASMILVDPTCGTEYGYTYHIFPAFITIVLTFLISMIILANKKKEPGTLTVGKKKKAVRKKGW